MLHSHQNSTTMNTNQLSAQPSKLSTMLKGMKKTLCLVGLTAAMLIGSQSESKAQVYYQTEIRPVTYTNYHPYYGYYTETRYEPVTVMYYGYPNNGGNCGCPRRDDDNDYPETTTTTNRGGTGSIEPGGWGYRAR